MAQSKVAVLKTSPSTVLADYSRLMDLADYQQFLPKDKETALKTNISWEHFYPGCSTTPWQLDGVISTLLHDGYRRERLYGCNNRTVVVDAKRGEVANKLKQVTVDKYGLRNIHLYEKGEEWTHYRPKAKMLALDTVYPEGIQIPKRLIGSNIIHLPTMKKRARERVQRRGAKDDFGATAISAGKLRPYPIRQWKRGIGDPGQSQPRDQYLVRFEGRLEWPAGNELPLRESGAALPEARFGCALPGGDRDRRWTRPVRLQFV